MEAGERIKEGLIKNFQLVVEQKCIKGVNTWWLYVCSFHTGKEYFAIQLTLGQFKGFMNNGIVRVYRDGQDIEEKINGK